MSITAGVVGLTCVLSMWGIILSLGTAWRSWKKTRGMVVTMTGTNLTKIWEEELMRRSHYGYKGPRTLEGGFEKAAAGGGGGGNVKLTDLMSSLEKAEKPHEEAVRAALKAAKLKKWSDANDNSIAKQALAWAQQTALQQALGNQNVSGTLLSTGIAQRNTGSIIGG